ncbi:flagella basal body P-ring formation protein FlgA [Rubricella aquisinus]|uniref:Flagella basal body P-ring formation protein FlgA n=1 Tax=Rubricella aquisinus TaxID=2028108 RepID=A0A840WXY3_9RHOB|nr:flagellar basal body P-ring formation chaperone FlgA [Rubricella aquisinus]MBB5515234.1 flagella basal body P-ring formation protein FlgA [Rubricella aquisinus]
MIRALILSLLITGPQAALADVLFATRTIRAAEVIDIGDVQRGQGDGPALRLEDVIGMEAQVTLYAGQPVHPSDVAVPAVIERNAPVILRFRQGALTIMAEGRALARARPGDIISVMNLQSRATVRGRVHPDGTVEVGS